MWKHLTKQSGGNFKGKFKLIQTCPNMEYKQSKGAKKKKYRENNKKTNETSAQFMAFASKEAPWLVEKFFAENKVSNISENQNYIKCFINDVSFRQNCKLYGTPKSS